MSGSHRISKTVEALVVTIRDSDMYGVALETGCGCPVAHALFAVSGASRTVLASLQPYDKSVTTKMFDNDGLRAVSAENVRKMLDGIPKLSMSISPTEQLPAPSSSSSSSSPSSASSRFASLVGSVGSFFTKAIPAAFAWSSPVPSSPTVSINPTLVFHDERVNTRYVASFQIGDINSPMRTHGWIGIWYKGCCRLFHLSVHEPSFDRQDLIQVIGEVGLELLVHMLDVDKPLCPGGRLTTTNVHIDRVEVRYPSRDSPSFQPSSYATLQFLYARSDKEMSSDSYIVINPAGKPIRLEEWCRDKARMVLYKGSFNPPTVEHVRLYGEATEQLLRMSAASASSASASAASLSSSTVGVAGVCGAFMISINTVDKGRVPLNALMRRILHITSLGMYCVVNGCGRFDAAINFFAQSFPATQVHLPVGQDTWDRIEPSLQASHGNSFLVSPRTPCSSTEARTLLAIREHKRSLEQRARLEALIPPSVLRLLL